MAVSLTVPGSAGRSQEKIFSYSTPVIPHLEDPHPPPKKTPAGFQCWNKASITVPHKLIYPPNPPINNICRLSKK
jgi:hypothetical protein